jgi:sarcosine oxidase gamma subunit
MARLAPTIPDPAPLPGVERRDLAVLAIRRLSRFGPDLPALAPLPADIAVGKAARADDLLLAAPAPGEWLLLGPHGTLADLARTQDPDAVLALEIGEACALFRLTPALAAEALAAYAPVDPAALAPGTATRARFAEMTALMIPEPDGSLLLLVDAADADPLIALLALLTPDR